MTALHLHPPAYTPSSDGKTMGWSLSPHSRTHGVQFHGRMHLRVMITPHNTRLAVPPLQLDGGSRVSTFAAHVGGQHAAYQVTCNSPPTPSHHARPLVSALPPRCVRKRSTATVHRHVLPPPSEPVHAPRVCCTSQLHQHRRVGSQHVVQSAGVECARVARGGQGDGGDAQDTQ
jgi:hypothetical protein